MVEIIEINTNLDDIDLQEDSNFSVNNGNIPINDNKLTININDDSIINIPAGNYKLLYINTDMGDININLPNTFFEEVKIKSNMGDLTINTNYNIISFDAFMGEYKNLNLHKKNNNIKHINNNIIKKAKWQLSTFKPPKKNNKDRYS